MTTVNGKSTALPSSCVNTTYSVDSCRIFVSELRRLLTGQRQRELSGAVSYMISEYNDDKEHLLSTANWAERTVNYF
jgi:hypothetical protein